MKITELGREEWEKLRAITLESLEMEPQAFSTTYEKKLAFDEYKWKKWLLPLTKLSISLTLFAVDEDGDVFGKATALFADKETIEIVGMYVRKAERRKGVAEQLLQGLINRIGSMYPNRKIICEVSNDQEAAVALYNKMGFREILSRKAKLGDGNEHKLLLMELAK